MKSKYYRLPLFFDLLTVVNVLIIFIVFRFSFRLGLKSIYNWLSLESVKIEQ